MFHEIDDFHTTENISIDVMHDILEGVCRYILSYLIYTFIYVNNYFTLDLLNLRIQNFDFNENERSNKPPIITLKSFKKN